MSGAGPLAAAKRAPGLASRPRSPARNGAPYLYLVPAGLLFLAILVLPMLRSFYFSLHDWDGLKPMVWIGGANYAALFSDPDFWNSIRVTLTWVVLSGGVLPLTALMLALLLEFGIRSARWRGLARTILFIPMTISLVAVGLLFALIYNPVMGVINNIPPLFGVLSTIDLLGNPNTTVLAIFAVAIWQWSGFGMVIFSAALQGLPSELIDAARIDGASKLQTIRHIVIPLLLPTYFVIATVNIIGGFKAFDLIYVMTAGGPAGTSETTSIFLYKQAFVLHQFGYASTVAVTLFAIVAIVTLALSKLRFRSAA
jgi:ABC-type sugar transport system permease subunit